MRIKKVKAQIAGTSHKRAKSFSAKEVAKYEETKAYRDQSICWIFPTRGVVPIEVVDSWDMIQWPMNQFRTCRITAKGLEVASAYNMLARIATDKATALEVLGSEEYADNVMKCRFIMTTEEDNIIPPFGLQQLLAAIYKCPDCELEVAVHCAGKKRMCKRCSEWRCAKGHKGYDGVSGLYSVKSHPPTPMVFGDPKVKNDFKPQSVKQAIKKGSVVECNGIAMGFAIFRKDAFKQVSKPWFDTTATMTQDLFFCKKAKKEIKARFAVHCGVQVAHLNPATGEFI